MKRTIFLLSFIFVFQFLFLPNVQAVSPWEGTPWEGTPWEGTPWKGDPWKGTPGNGGDSESGDGSWKGTPWEGTPGNDDDSQSKDGSWEGSPWEGGTSEGSNTDGQGTTTEESGTENMCLPIPANDWGDYTPRSSSSITDEERKEILRNTTEELVKDHPELYAAINKDPEGYVEAANNALDNLLDRPYGTIDDLDIPSDVLANMANMGYSDDKVSDKKRKEVEETLLEDGWEEKGTREHWSGFEGRVFVNRNDGTIAFSFGGTEYKRDYFADGKIATGRHTGQYDQAAKFVEEMMKRYPDYQPVLVGHSLGGAIAQYISMQTQIPATTFNAPGIGTREYSFGDTLKDGKWYATPASLLLKTAMNEGSFHPLVDQLNRERLFDDLIINNIMEDDEIGTYQIHLGQTNVYTDDGDVEIKYDYSAEAHSADLPASKAAKTIKDIRNSTPSHGLGNFTDIMEECY